MIQADIRWPLTAEARVLSCPYDIQGGQTGSGTGSIPVTLSVSFHHYSILISFVTVLLSERQTSDVWKPLNRGVLC